MSLILCTENDIILASGLKIRVVSKTFDVERCFPKVEIELPSPIPYKKNADNSTETEKPHQEDPSKSSILGGSLSSDHSMMALIDSRKQVTLWSCSDWKLLQQWAIPRRPIKTVFTPDGSRLLVADKGGDVISFDVKSAEDGFCLLGHLSMLLDLIFSNCGKFVLTCDRDEKIRVSRYPNSYNINNFCLGHSEFVTGLFLCPHRENILISTSGDGTIKAWRYLEGLELHSQACLDYLEKEVESQGDKVPAVTNIKCARLDEESSIVVVTVNGFDGFLVFKSIGSDGKLAFQQRIMTKGPIRDMEFDCTSSSGIKLFALAPSEEACFLAYQVIGDELKLIDFLGTSEDKENLKRFLNESCNTPAFSTDELYKKWFDNMAEYMQKKEQRICKLKSQAKVGDLDTVDHVGGDDVCVKRMKI